MSIQEACEEMESLLEVETKATNPKLTIKQFMALNKILMEMNFHGEYEIPDKYYEGG